MNIPYKSIHGKKKLHLFLKGKECHDMLMMGSL